MTYDRVLHDSLFPLCAETVGSQSRELLHSIELMLDKKGSVCCQVLDGLDPQFKPKVSAAGSQWIEKLSDKPANFAFI